MNLPLFDSLISFAKQVKEDSLDVVSLSGPALDFALSGELQGVLNNALRSLVNDPMANPSTMQTDNVVLLDEHLGVLIAIGRTSFRESNPVYSAPSATLIIPLTKSGFASAHYEIVGKYDFNIFNKSVSVRQSSIKRHSLGEVVVFESGKVTEYASHGDVVLKIFDRRTSTGLMWEFDRSSGQATAAYASDLESTTLRYLLRFLATYPDYVNAESVELLLSHPYHFVRWEALKTLAVVDHESACSILPKLTQDVHPHIRSAAKKMMQVNGLC